MEQNDLEKFTDLMEITSSQVFVHLFRKNFDDIMIKKIIFYAQYLLIVQMLLKVTTLNVSRLQTKLILQKYKR